MTPGQLHHQNTSMHYDSGKLYPRSPYAIFRYIYHGVISSLAIDHCFLYLSFVDLLDLGYSAVLCISLLTWDRTFKLGRNCYTTLLSISACLSCVLHLIQWLLNPGGTHMDVFFHLWLIIFPLHHCNSYLSWIDRLLMTLYNNFLIVIKTFLSLVEANRVSELW